MPSGPGNQRRMGEARGGMPGPPTCTLLFLNPTLIAVNSCRCWINDSVSSGLHEPPYTEPYVRWCGRTAEVTPPPTRCVSVGEPRSGEMFIEPSETLTSVRS